MNLKTRRLVACLITVLTAASGFAASLALAAPPNLPAINQAPTGLQLTGKLTWFDLLTGMIWPAPRNFAADRSSLAGNSAT